MYTLSAQRLVWSSARRWQARAGADSTWKVRIYTSADYASAPDINRSTDGHGTGEATISTLVDAVVRFLGGAMEVDSRHESKGERKEEKFVNEGLIKWKEGRKKWLAASASGQKRPRRRPPRVDDEVILETIFAKPTGWLLPHPVPLAHMVELLEDEWSD